MTEEADHIDTLHAGREKRVTKATQARLDTASSFATSQETSALTEKTKYNSMCLLNKVISKKKILLLPALQYKEAQIDML